LNSLENAERNNCEHISVFEGDASLLINKKYDVIIANINRNILLNDMQSYMNCLNDNGVILFSGFYQEDIPIIDAEVSKYDFKIDAWVMLPDHLHCIWTLPEGDSEYVKRWALIKRKVTQELSDARSNKGEGIIWQRRYWEHKISCDNDYQKHMDYIHYNPVKHGVVKQVKDWRFSSFHRLVRDKVYPLDWGGSYQEQFCNYGE